MPLDISVAAIGKCLRGFSGVANRFETIWEKDGFRIINDSKANNPTAAIAAVQAVRGPMILLMGGRNRVKDLRPIADAIKSNDVKGLVCYGPGGTDILSALGNVTLKTAYSKEFESAVRQASALVNKGQTLLFAPACTVTPRFATAEERGDYFKELAGKWLKSHNP
ncbi:glutamate ligase domain-containing protein [Verrucomicrobiota bacterium]